jgi:hypothetical protein
MTIEPGDERPRFSREALARLVLSDQVVRVAEYATGLVNTRNDTDTGLGGRASQAAHLATMAQNALVSAVIYERQRGAAWADIGHYLDMSGADVEHRFAAQIAAWQQALDDADRSPTTPGLPLALRDPAHVGNCLDTWAHRRISLTKDRHEVTGSMLKLPLPGEPGWRDVDAEEQAQLAQPHGIIDHALFFALGLIRRALARPRRSR